MIAPFLWPQKAGNWATRKQVCSAGYEVDYLVVRLLADKVRHFLELDYRYLFWELQGWRKIQIQPQSDPNCPDLAAAPDPHRHCAD